MQKLCMSIGLATICAMAALSPAQAQMDPAFREKITNPLRTTPAGMTPLMDPRTSQRPSAATEMCLKNYDEVLYQVSNWRDSARKDAALRELEAARTAIRGDDSRTCDFHVKAALNGR